MAVFLKVSGASCAIWSRNSSELQLSSTKCRAQMQGSRSNETVDPNSTSTSSSSSSQSTLQNLERLTQSGGSNRGNTIASKLITRYGEEGSDFTVPLVYSRTKKPKISIQRNIKRQEYLDKVSQRDDSKTFATVGLFVLVPPLAILVVAIAVGYVQLFP